MSSSTQSLPVGSVGSLAGVTVRTLHHYDQIGLLVPSDRSRAGYRLYDKADLERLRQILLYRELGFALEEIAELLESGIDRLARLGQQRALVAERIDRLRAVAAAIDRELEAAQMGIQLSPEEQFEIFGEHYRADYQAEAEQRWGRTEAYQQSQRRASSYRKDQWLQIKAESSAIEQDLVRLLVAGVPADAEPAMDAAEAHRQHIITWFNDVPLAMHRGMAELYLADPRFAAYYNKITPGLADYLSAAIVANADRLAG